MVEIVAKYWENIEDRDVIPSVQPAYLRPLLPSEAPINPDNWEDIYNDIQRVIMPGITHWQSPHFHAWFPSGVSTASLCADMLCSGFGVIGFSWQASPACTELEIIVLDWLAKALGLPDHFHASKTGGGVIQGSASEATLLAVLAAQKKMVDIEKKKGFSEEETRSKLILYSSEEGHSSVERAALFAKVKIKQLSTDDNFMIRPTDLEKAIAEDREAGLIPILLVATHGTTRSCSFDNLEELGPICKKENMWLHVDAAYAGNSYICPEFRKPGLEYTDSFCMNPHKWLLTNFDCTAFWVKEANYLVDSLSVDREYYSYDQEGLIHDFRNWQIPLGRRFRSLKLWFVLRAIGISGLQAYIRKHVSLAKSFGDLVSGDSRFELAAPVSLGLVCFRLKGPNELTQYLLKKVKETHKIFMIGAMLKDVFTIRFVVCSEKTELQHIEYAWDLITSFVPAILQEAK
jgi:aromatic-L-amino-acid decarboxylase